MLQRGIVNSEDSDQTAPLGAARLGSELFCTKTKDYGTHENAF